MARRRKYQKRTSALERLREWDWSIEPETQKAVIATILLILGALLLLAFFGSAGKLGEFFSAWTKYLFGFPGYIVPLVFLFIGGGLILGKFSFRPLQVISLILLFVFLPILFYPDGGIIGEKITPVFRNSFGPYAAFLIILGFNLIFIFIVSNTSFERIINYFWTKEDEESDKPDIKVNQKRVSVFATVKKKISGFSRPNGNLPEAPSKKIIEIKRDANWEFPSLDLLQISNTEASPGNINRNVEIIQKTLKDFSINVAMSNVNVGPTVTQYTLKPAEGVKLSNITARTNDLSLSLAAHPIRVEAPIPGKSAVGVEVPNKQAAIVTLRELIESSEYKKSHSPLSIALGRNVSGEPVVADLERMPHLLIAGATGSGKSIALNAILTTFLYRNSPLELKIILVDPKRVEFTHYNNIPHLLTPVITEVDKTIAALKWLTSEMDRRFKLFSESHHRNIQEYNHNSKGAERLPYIVIIIDELADLMAQAANEVEGAIVRLAQMARATGIHLIVATQRPSVNVITGLIKANITARIAFAVASQVDSRTIIDMGGAEKLLGNGDMLYLSNDIGKPRRVQGCFISTREVEKVTGFLKQEAPNAQYNEEITNFKSDKGRLPGDLVADDNLYREAKDLVVQAGRASASLLQRRLRVGYARAARLLDLLESEGIISPADGAKPRDILIARGETEIYNEHRTEQESYRGEIN